MLHALLKLFARVDVARFVLKSLKEETYIHDLAKFGDGVISYDRWIPRPYRSRRFDSGGSRVLSKFHRVIVDKRAYVSRWPTENLLTIIGNPTC